MLSRPLFVSIATALALSACAPTVDESPVVASVYGYELHESDLEGLVGEGVAHDDSVAIVDNYVDQWIRQTVMLAKAEKNVTADFSRQLKEYRNSMLIHAYEQQIVNQLLDTTVSEGQIEEYYANHRDEFLLKSSIVKAVYVVAPRKTVADGKLRSLMGRSDFAVEDIADLEALASRHGLRGYYDADVWMPFYTLQASVPIITYNENLYLKQNRYITLHDDSLNYYVRVLDYKVSDETAPLELQRDNIRAIIVNHRKTALLGKLQADLLAEAAEGRHIKSSKKKEQN